MINVFYCLFSAHWLIVAQDIKSANNSSVPFCSQGYHLILAKAAKRISEVAEIPPRIALPEGSLRVLQQATPPGAGLVSSPDKAGGKHTFWSYKKMKKTIVAAAVLGALAGSAFAGDVTLYGVVDTGLMYQRSDSDLSGKDSVNNFSMESGIAAASRFGLKGSEDLGDGWKIGFVLENGFDSDTGTLSSYSGERNRIFGREATLNITSPYGTIGMGRMGALNSGNGTYGIAGNFSPFGTTYKGAGEGNFLLATGGRFDNTVVYKTPEFYGFNVYAQYSFGVDGNSDGVENKASSDRYLALGATFKSGPAAVALVVDSYNFNSSENRLGKDDDDSIGVTLGGSYDFEVVKVYAGAQYFDDMRASLRKDGEEKTSNTSLLAVAPGEVNKGYGIVLGADVPLCGGTAKFAVGYANAEDVNDSDNDLDRWGVAVGYTYNLSKRTMLYSNVNYIEDKYGQYEGHGNAKRGEKPTKVQAMFGLTHKF